MTFVIYAPLFVRYRGLRVWGRPRLRRARPGGAGLRLRLPRCTPPRSQSVWEKLAEYFGVSVSYLMGLTDTLVFSQDWDKGWHTETIIIDVERVQKEYIDGKKPLEIIVSNLTEYLLLANLVSLDPSEMETLLQTVQVWNGRSSRDSERRSSCQPNTDVSCRTPPKTKLRRGSHI